MNKVRDLRATGPEFRPMTPGQYAPQAPTFPMPVDGEDSILYKMTLGVVQEAIYASNRAAAAGGTRFGLLTAPTEFTRWSGQFFGLVTALAELLGLDARWVAETVAQSYHWSRAGAEGKWAEDIAARRLHPNQTRMETIPGVWAHEIASLLASWAGQRPPADKIKAARSAQS